MHAEHVIARCTWLTEFDERSGASNLQDFISHWSNTVLHDELDRCFRRWCPAPQTWRLPALQLDLGEVALDELARTLPLRLRAALDDAMRRLFAARGYTVEDARSDPGVDERDRHGADADARAGDALHVLDQAAAMKSFLAFYLQNGNLPWWCGRDVNALELLDRALAAPGHAGLDVLREVLRDVGRGASVRKRLVWQLGAGRMARIVHVLEPWHGGFICGWTDNLCAVQAQRQIAPATPSGFRDVIWLTVLTHLLVDRGSVFNTVAFMRASLWQTAQRYQLDYRQLLSRLLQAAEVMAPTGLVTHDFFVALGLLGAHDLAPPAAPPPAPAPPAADHWSRFEALLRHSGQGGAAAPGPVAQLALAASPLAIGDLFAALAGQDPERMARALRRHGHAASVREGLLRLFTADKLAGLVRVLAPHDHAFIIAHAAHAQALAEAQRWGGKTVWRVLLAYLLLAQGSYFHRRQLIHDTLRKICAAQRLDLAVVLDLLIASVGAGQQNHHRFALLVILRDLRDGAARRRERSALPALAGLPSARLWRRLAAIDSRLVAQWLQEQPDPARRLAGLPTERPLGRLTRHLLARLPPELRSPRGIVRQWSAVLRQGGLWQGTSAILEGHLYHVFWQVGFGPGAHARGAGELLARMMAAACQRLGLAVAQCLAAFQARPQLLVATPWRAGAAWLQRRSAAPPPITDAAVQAPAAGNRLSTRTKRTTPGASTMNDDKPALAARNAAGATSPIRINNAGLAILQGFFMPYLMRLELVEQRQFVSEQARLQAVHCLQFLVSGQSQTPEQYLTFNKLLCGLPLHEPVEAGFEMTASQVQLGESLLRSVIGNWSAIGTSSISGFRGNWLVRDGALIDAGDHWDLIVERRAYDILLARSPMTYSVIKLPWMEKPIYVTWPT